MMNPFLIMAVPFETRKGPLPYSPDFQSVNIYIIVFTGIDHACPALMDKFTLKMSVTLVNMSVEHEFWPYGIEKCIKTDKSSVGQVLQISPASGRSMGDENVDPAVEDGLQPCLESPLFHLCFCIHAGALFIAK